MYKKKKKKKNVGLNLAGEQTEPARPGLHSPRVWGALLRNGAHHFLRYTCTLPFLGSTTVYTGGVVVACWSVWGRGECKPATTIPLDALRGRSCDMYLILAWIIVNSN